MRHSEPRIQELAEAIQGALLLVSGRRITWYADQTGYGGWNLRFVVLPSSPDRPNAYSCGCAISHDALHTTQWWASIKHGIMLQILHKLADDSKPAEEKDVTWLAAPWIEPVKENQR